MVKKYIFVTGGVVSGIGKGIATASIGFLLKNSGYFVDVIKFDPYLNVDPGTMSPYEHGEVFVLEDGSETDLDLGHYERFLDVNLTKESSITSGKIYASILEKERKGDFLGKNVQLIPNVTDYIQTKFSFENTKNKENKKHIRLIEIGGSTGDMEGEIYLESLRQFKQKHKNQIIHIHLGYIPFLHCSNEYKTKPIQNSIRELLRLGLQPDFLIARYYPEKKELLSEKILSKIALFANLDKERVIALPDLDSIYKVPKYLTQTNLVSSLIKLLDQPISTNLSDFFEKGGEILESEKKVVIGICGKYLAKLGDADYSLQQSIKIAGFKAKTKVEILLLDAEKFEKQNSKEWQKLAKCQAIIVPGGFGNRGLLGKINVCKYARENKIPFLGICLGLQMAVVEFGRNILNLNAFSREMLENTNLNSKNLKKIDFMVDYMEKQLQITNKGASMRLGAFGCNLKQNTLAKKLYKTDKIIERHRHRLEIQSKYIDLLEKNGMICSGVHFVDKTKNTFLVEIMELKQKLHPFYIGIQSHPEFLSRPDKPHPLFYGLIKAVK